MVWYTDFGQESSAVSLGMDLMVEGAQDGHILPLYTHLAYTDVYT